MTRVYWVRHCESIANQENRFAGHAEFDITPVGQKQLECLSRHFENIHIDKIISSPISRAYKTAQAINKHHGLEIEVCENLKEMSLGRLDRVLFREIGQEYIDLWNNHPEQFQAPGGESMQEVCDRGVSTLKNIVKNNPNKTIAITSHGGLTGPTMCILKGLPLEELNSVRWAENTGIYIIDFENENSWKLIQENYTGHLNNDCEAVPVESWK